MDLVKYIENKAKKIDGKIILPEASFDERVKNACKTILKKKLSKIIVFGKTEDFGKEFLTPDCEIIDINNYPNKKQLIKKLYELRKEKGLTMLEAGKLIENPLYFATMLVKTNKADGIVAGAVFTTANVLRPALQIIKTKKSRSIVTGSMIMVKEEHNPLLFGDISLVQSPNAEQLAEIAYSNYDFMENVLGIDAKVAMLSFSTKGSASSPSVDMVREATLIAKTKGVVADGEMQADAALSRVVAKNKGIDSKIGGRANVLIFPDLNAGNIGYKLTKFLGGYEAIGPIMLNFNKPVNDLSRGCDENEIVTTVCITKLQIEN